MVCLLLVMAASNDVELLPQHARHPALARAALTMERGLRKAGIFL
jgi:hypothetical protein